MDPSVSVIFFDYNFIESEQLKRFTIYRPIRVKINVGKQSEILF